MPPVVVLDILVVALSFWRVVDKRILSCSTVWKAQLVLQLDIRAMMQQGNRRLNILIAAGSLFFHFYVIMDYQWLRVSLL
jgi:hypothetical protein